MEGLWRKANLATKHWITFTACSRRKLNIVISKVIATTAVLLVGERLTLSVHTLKFALVK
jgi:hypothetical protein